MNLDRSDILEAIKSGKTVLGIEFGSTRIKAVLIGEDHAPLASGSHDWENRYENGVWTYSLDDVWTGLQDSYRKLSMEVLEKYNTPLQTIGAIGFSGMMHGYLAFDQDENLLVPFRTWRNTLTEQAARDLTELFQFNIPQRWSIAHLYQAILNGEAHVKDISYLTTLAGYVHWKLTGQKVLGIGEASGMFPIDSQINDYDARMVGLFNERIEAENVPWKLQDILPKVLTAGDAAGVLTEAGAKLLDPAGQLQAGIPLCPPEGDAGTGMVATNSIAERTGNVSAGTSVFAMIVLEKALSKVYPEIDMVTTPQANLLPWCTATTAPPTSMPGSVCSRNSPNLLVCSSINPNCLRCCIKRHWKATRIAGVCLPIIIFRVSQSPTLRKGAPCSSVHLKAASHWRTSCGCICSRRWGH